MDVAPNSADSAIKPARNMSNNIPKKEAHELWFSYAGKDQAQVQQITDALTAYQNTLSTQQQGSGIYLTAQKFQYPDKDTDGYHYHLKLGQSILELSINIASSLLKVIVLSEDYFKSPACLEELCLCLCSNHCNENVYPLFVILEPETQAIFSNNYAFQIPTTVENKTEEYAAKTQQTTLADALEQTYQYLKETFVSLPGFNLDSKTRSDFQKITTDLKRTICGIFPQNATEADEKDIAKQLYEAGKLIIERALNKDHLEFIKVRFEQITRTEPITTLINRHPKRTLDFDAEFKNINNFSDASQFIRTINQGLDNISADLHKKLTKQYLGELCSLAYLKTMTSKRAQLLSHFHHINGLIPVPTISSKWLFMEELFCGFSHSLATGKAFYFDDNWDHNGFEHTSIPGFIDASFRESSPNDNNRDDNRISDKLFKLLRNLNEKCNPQFQIELPEKAADFCRNEDLIADLADDINYEIANKNTIRAIKVKGANRDHYGSHAVLVEFAQLFHAHPVKLPAIELMRQNSNNSEPNVAAELSTTLFDNQDYKQFKRAVSELFEKQHDLNPK